jgi:hypothetical protein
LLLNIGFATASLGVIYLILGRYKLRSRFRLLTLLSVILAGPLSAIILIGMEHNLQILLDLLFIYLSVQILADPTEKLKFKLASTKIWLALAPLVVLVRYEGLFIIAIVGLLLLLRKAWLYGVLLGFLTGLPLALYSVYSISQGSFWLPNSVLLKGHSPGLSLNGLLDFFNFLSHYKDNPDILVLMLVALGLYIIRFNQQRDFWESRQLLLLIFLVTAFLHLAFVTNWFFFRYEAYLVVVGLTVISLGLADYLAVRKLEKKPTGSNLLARNLAIAGLILLLVQPLLQRANLSTVSLARVSANIYGQQYQMALFFKQFYATQAIAANDIGAINFLSDLHCLDLWGLASTDVATAIINGTYSTESVAALAKAKGVKVAIAYDPLPQIYPRVPVVALPSSWVKVGEWKLHNNLLFGTDTVGIYAVDASEQVNLRSHLVQFASQLPVDVEQTLLTNP